MPPKGSKKNSDGKYQLSSAEKEIHSIDDVLFPKATLLRLARAILPEGNIISKDSSLVIQRSATVFVNYLLVFARENAKKNNRKTVGPQDIIAGLESSEFSSFIPSVRQELETYQRDQEILKQKRKEQKTATEPAVGNDSNQTEDESTETEPSTKKPKVLGENAVETEEELK